MASSLVSVAAPDQADRAISTLTTAFSADPILRWMLPDPHVYLSAFPAITKLFAGDAFQHGSAYQIANYAGVALWLPPDVHPDEEAMGKMIMQVVPEERQENLFTLFEQMNAGHPSAPHWYLPVIGVDPRQQGKGYGSELLLRHLAKCDADGLAAYLEASSADSRRLYERHGFEVTGTLQVGDSPPAWMMVRQPR